MAPLDRDRQTALLSQTQWNGIDYVEIASPDQTILHVHFFNEQPALQGTMTAATITGGETIPTVGVRMPIQPSDWIITAGRPPILILRVDEPGDFSTYTLTLTSPRLDPFFASVLFSFKAGCPSTLDCAPPPVVCPPAPDDAPPIDYLAKDFPSFRKALSDFSALRYPEWQERSEADFGMMFMEALCALADDLSYTQDRIAAEASLDTATQRRSIVRHARLVDYEPRPATAARVLLQFDVTGGPIPAGVVVSAQRPDGTAIDFETGTGLADLTNYPTSPAWNRGIWPSYFDDSRACLRIGATEVWVEGQGFGFMPGQLLLIDTQTENSADPPVREIVQLVSATEEIDPLFGNCNPGVTSGVSNPPPPARLTHLVWRPEDALKHDHDLTLCTGCDPVRPFTVLAGNLVPATQGRRQRESFAIETLPPDAASMELAVARLGPNSTPDAPAYQYLHTLQNAPLVWLSQDDPEAPPLPEIRLVERSASPPRPWDWQISLLQAGCFDPAFTLDPARYRPVGPQTVGAMAGTNAQDYDGDAGDTVRFGDGVFGDVPDCYAVFQVTYRVGGGAEGNVAADSIQRVDPSTPPGIRGLITLVTNPFPAAGGADAEPNERVQRLAPQKFRAVQYRAVRPEDYQAAAERLPWVERAGTVFRWTGSWMTVFTTADPKESEFLSVAEHTELIDLLNRYRLAGYESYAPEPRYVSLDLRITVCAQPEAFRGDVEAAVLAALSTQQFLDGTTGFFHHGRFTFGMPLERSALEAAIQEAHGVAGVLSIEYRRRGYTPDYVPLPPTILVGASEIVRVDNDPSRPEAGALKIDVEGGK